jgi:hypothetical protein
MLGHSLGGILIEQALVNAQANPRLKNTLGSTFGLVFMGTPHAGHADSMTIDFGKMCANIVRHVSGNGADDLIMAVENGSIFSDILREHFRHHLDRYQIISCYETLDVVCYSSALVS